MADSEQNIIEFQYGAPGIEDPKPYRAAATIPDWLKNMPAAQNLPGYHPIGTVKACLPFLDALTAGYVIPLRATVQFAMTQPSRLECKHPDIAQHGAVLEYQNPASFEGAPFAQGLVVKFVNHWIVKTPPGYSTLFIPPLNQFAVPFHMLAGLVDTDSYARQIFFPAVCLMQPGMSFEFSRGAPLMQAIPVKRSAWESHYSVVNPAEQAKIEARTHQNPHHYRDDNWSKKEYR
jgi:hypothetical protein